MDFNMSLKYENIIRQMTLAEKAQMMSGKNTWETVDFEKYGIPSMFMSDGPHGLRRQAGAGDHLGLNGSLPWFRISDRYKEINVEQALADKDSIFYYYKKLIELRHKESMLTEGNYQLILPEDEKIFAYLRNTENESWLVAANMSEDTISTDRLKTIAKEKRML